MANEQQLSDRLAYRARPTIRVDGSSSPAIAELLIAMRMTEHEGGMSELELRFANLASAADASGLAFEDEAIFAFGAELSVYAGDEQAPQEIFRGKVTGLEGQFSTNSPPELSVLAEDALQLARMSRRTQLHDNVSIDDVAQAVAKVSSLRPVVSGFSEKLGPQLQLNESDLAFLRRLLRAYDGDLQVTGSELHVAPRSQVQRNTVNLRMFSQLLHARVTADVADQATAVSVSGWDPARAQRFAVTSTGSALGPGAGRAGARVLSDALGNDRKEHLGHVAAISETEARALADASFDQRARRFVVMQATSDGNPAIRVGSHVSVDGMSTRFNNVFYVTRASHRFNLSSGYLTDFEAECAYLGDA